MIGIFKTNVRTKTEAKRVLRLVNSSLSEVKANFDLKDCDRILRLQGINECDLPVVEAQVASLGFNCELLH